MHIYRAVMNVVYMDLMYIYICNIIHNSINVYSMCHLHLDRDRIIIYNNRKGEKYSKTVLYSALRSLLSPVFCVFWNFTPIPMYRENKTPYAIPT